MRALVAAVGLVLGISAPAIGQSSRCADCHFASPFAPNASHLTTWDRSPHGRAGVGCDSCHGGDSSTFEQFLAHRGILHSTVSSSPVNPLNLPATCGSCHAGPYVAFQDSWHFRMQRAGDARAPTCSTCHGEVLAYRLSPKELGKQCAACHGPKGIAPRPDRAEDARLLLEDISGARRQLADARALIRKTVEKSRRAALEEAARQAEVPLAEATQNIHRFVFDAARDRLDVARYRIGMLVGNLTSVTAP
jgi:hypothetical protein